MDQVTLSVKKSAAESSSKEPDIPVKRAVVVSKRKSAAKLVKESAPESRAPEAARPAQETAAVTERKKAASGPKQVAAVLEELRSQLFSAQRDPFLRVAVDLGTEKCAVGFSDGSRDRFEELPARNLAKFEEAKTRAISHFGLPADVETVCIHEAGRDGFWFHRWLEDEGIHSLLIDAGSVERAPGRRRKTDRTDAKKMLRLIDRLLLGDSKVCRLVQAPSAEHEDARRLTREMYQLQREELQHYTRIMSCFVRHGIKGRVDDLLRKDLGSLVGADGRKLGAHEQNEIERLAQRMQLARQQLKEVLRTIMRMAREELEREKQEREDQESSKPEKKRPYHSLYIQMSRPPQGETSAEKTEREAQEKKRWDRIQQQMNDASEEQRQAERARQKMVLALSALRGIGLKGAAELVNELYWRNFSNRNDVGAATGFAPLSDVTGIQPQDRSTGIGKQSRHRLRSLLLEQGWSWLRYQPDSAISKWYTLRFASGNRRVRRIGIVAVTRKLAVMLWHYLQSGKLPEGVVSVV